jgi:hypothetical protein
MVNISEIVPVERRAAAVGHVHVDEAVPTVGLVAGDQH